jgi:hypothetical protein
LPAGGILPPNSPVQSQVFLVSWSIDSYGHDSRERRGPGEESDRVVLDRDGVEWSVREMATPHAWARAPHCLVLSSRECVRRVWSYPSDWRTLDADKLLRLGSAD